MNNDVPHIVYESESAKHERTVVPTRTAVAMAATAKA